MRVKIWFILSVDREPLTYDIAGIIITESKDSLRIICSLREK
jgi:hypothetical protein